MERTIDLQLIQIRQRELDGWIALLQRYFPRLVLGDRTMRTEPVQEGVGTVARLQANGELQLAVAVSESEELCTLVPGEAWGWR